jgi:hypothetical protein
VSIPHQSCSTTAKRNWRERAAVLFDETCVKEIFDLRGRLDDADLEQQIRRFLVEGQEFAREEFLVRGLVLPAQIFCRVAELLAGLFHVGSHDQAKRKGAGQRSPDRSRTRRRYKAQSPDAADRGRRAGH